MGLINLDEYNRKYGYTIGKLMVEKKSNEVEALGKEAIFDTNTLNFHFYPSDKTLCDKWATDIGNKIKDIENVINADTTNNYAILPKREDINETPEDNKIYFWTGSSGHLRGTKCNLFKYIVAVKNKHLYELNFMRFYIATDKSVNCIVKSIQFDRVVNGKTANQHGICYPTSYSGQSKNTLKKKLVANENRNFFYNPQVNFNEESEIILDAFVDFIDTCESPFDNNNINP